eukprot:EG_transcript_16143
MAGQPVIVHQLPPSDATSITVLSYNLLAPCYVRVEGQPWNAYAHCEAACLEWEARREGLLAELLACGADVLCLQEVLFEETAGRWHLPQWMAPLVQKGYTALLPQWKDKEWASQAERNMRVLGKRVTTGVVILFQHQKLSSCREYVTGSRSLVCFLRQGPNPADSYAVANVHLEGNPELADKQVAQLRAALSKVPREFPNVILCGDFNAECAAGSPLATYIAAGTPVPMAEAPTGITWAEPGRGLRLDHLLYSATLDVDALLDRASAEVIEKGLPSPSCPSDHLPAPPGAHAHPCRAERGGRKCQDIWPTCHHGKLSGSSTG